jgi:hypothetical protein
MRVEIDGIKYVPQKEPSSEPSALAALDLRMPEDCDAGSNITMRDYLHELLVTLWQDGEGFSGKRPFGNSGWEWDLYAPLIRGGYVDGVLDSDGRIETLTQSNRDGADAFIFEMIRAAFYGVVSEQKEE